MQAVHTAAEPPNQAKMIFAIIGCTWNSRKALKKIVRAYRIMNLVWDSPWVNLRFYKLRRLRAAGEDDPPTATVTSNGASV